MRAVKSQYRKKQEAKEQAAKSLRQTKKRLGIGPAKALRGAKAKSPCRGDVGEETEDSSYVRPYSRNGARG